MTQAIMRHASDNALHVVSSRAGYDAPEWVYVRDVAAGEDASTLAWVNGQLVVDLTTLKADLLADIDTAAGVARRKWLTMAAGQADAYREKMVDVASLNGLAGNLAGIVTALGLLTPAQQKARWPFLWAEKDVQGFSTLIQARDAITAAADASRAARGEIERIRRAGKVAVRAAATAAAAKAAAAAVIFPS